MVLVMRAFVCAALSNDGLQDVGVIAVPRPETHGYRIMDIVRHHTCTADLTSRQQFWCFFRGPRLA
jgi:hypothetical protein